MVIERELAEPVSAKDGPNTPTKLDALTQQQRQPGDKIQPCERAPKAPGTKLLKVRFVDHADFAKTLERRPARRQNSKPSKGLLWLIKRLCRRFALSQAIARERQALSHLDARLLDDIGLTRKDVASETRRGFGDLPSHR